MPWNTEYCGSDPQVAERVDAADSRSAVLQGVRSSTVPGDRVGLGVPILVGHACKRSCSLPGSGSTAPVVAVL